MGEGGSRGEKDGTDFEGALCKVTLGSAEKL